MTEPDDGRTNVTAKEASRLRQVLAGLGVGVGVLLVAILLASLVFAAIIMWLMSLR